MRTLKREMALTAEAFPTIALPPGEVASRSDELVVVLPPRGSSEVKLAATAGAHITYRWSATGPVTHHLHVDQPQGASRTAPPRRSPSPSAPRAATSRRRIH